LEWFRGREFGQQSQHLLASFDGPARAIRCASAIAHHASRLGIEMSAGLHIGECEVTSEHVRGAAVDTASRIQHHARVDEIVVSSTVRDLVAGSGIRFQHHGVVTAGGGDETLSLFLVERSISPNVAA
jgi:class 3 adenylate cyclase